jgi:hypothetical protein
MGYVSSKCFSKTKRENRVSQFSVKKNSHTRDVTCFACGEKGHFAKELKNSRKKRAGPEEQRSEKSGNGKGL